MSKAKEKETGEALNAETPDAVRAVENEKGAEHLELTANAVSKKEAAPRSAVPSADFSCYIGPNLYGVIQTATIYPVGREEALELPEVKLALSRRPEIAVLIVDGSTLAEDRIKVKQPGTPLYEAYRALKKKAGG